MKDFWCTACKRGCKIVFDDKVTVYPLECLYSDTDGSAECLIWKEVVKYKASKAPAKLTAEVFNRPDCPKWAKFAAVDENGRAYYFEGRPRVLACSFAWSPSSRNYMNIPGRFDASDWQNSLIERPAGIPDWCKVGAWVWINDGRNFYCQIAAVYNFGVIDIRDVKCSLVHTGVNIKNVTPARVRPWTFEEAPIVLKVKKINTEDMIDVLHLDVYHGANPMHSYASWARGKNFPMSEVSDRFVQLDDLPCGVLEHQDNNGEWVE